MSRNRNAGWRSQNSPRKPLIEEAGTSRDGFRSFRSQSELRGGRNVDRSRNDKNNVPQRNRRSTNFSFKYLESLLEKPLEEVVQKLAQNKDFFDYIGQKLSTDNIVLIVKLLSRFSSCNFPSLRINILQRSLTSGFVDNLQLYIANLAFQSTRDKKLNSYYWKDPDSFWQNLLEFCKISLKESPHFFIDNLLKLVKCSLLNIKAIEEQHNLHICDETKDNLQLLIDRAEEIKANSERKIPSENKNFVDDGEEEPPDDFHEISIFPTTFELMQTSKPFLRKNIVIGPYRDVNHYLDVQFRLLREDFVGPLRLGIQDYLSGKSRREIQDIKIHPKVQFLNPVTATGDYCALLKFHFDGKLSNFKFEDSRKFMFGSLVCFTNDNFNTILFGRIADRKIDYLKNGQLVIGFNKLEDLIYNKDYLMVECSIYFEPYYHVLKVLKGIREEEFPMKNYIVDVDKTVSMPEFADPMVPYQIKNRRNWYLFNGGLNPTFDDLNESQNKAFIAALTRKFSIIQGPPGTGKTYVGLKVAKTLLDNSDLWCKDSPMLVICFTNHALDQFLEGLIDTTDKIVRIGGQSKNEKLKRFHLREHARKMSNSVWRAKDEVTSCLRSIKNVTDILQSIAKHDCILNFRVFADVIPNFRESWLAKANEKDFLLWLLAESVPNTEDNSGQEQFSLIEQFENVAIEDSEDEEEEEVNERDEIYQMIANMESHMEAPLLDLKQLQRQISSNYQSLNQLMSQIEDNEEITFQYLSLEAKNNRLKAMLDIVKQNLATASDNVTEKPKTDVRHSKHIPVSERWNLYFYWINLYKEKLLRMYEKFNVDYRRAYEMYNELQDLSNIEVLRTMKVVGMTTTGAARLHSSLQVLKCPIVIVEEAAEVLEAHIVSALTTSCQQLILIGDHQQLRPNTANFKMEKYYNLGISLFERMVQNEVQCFTLNIQHRMRPEISALIKPSIYPDLKDHESVLDRPRIKGIDKCLYFIDHKSPEESSAGSSKKNIHEAKFLAHLARYLILNGYKPEQITILAAYLGQMFEIQKEKKKMHLLQNVRISVLDNYQGEESDIILLSLVRNNEENRIGFLSIDNRVCVALSRARNGFYIMGNMSLLCEKSQLWGKIKATLVAQEAIGPSLALKCQNHNNITMVANANNFSLVSEGGCDEICNNSLVCGHRCKMQCHSYDKDHEKYICAEKCNRLLCDKDLTHICTKRCGQECGPCDYPKNVTLGCGHKAVIPCHLSPEEYNCVVEVQVTLRCGHDANKPCYMEADKYKCKIPCDARLDCGHSCIKKCHAFEDPDHLSYKCAKPCAKFREGCTDLKNEEHMCTKLCYEECEPCRKLVRKARTVCPHFFDVACSENVDDIICYKPCKKTLDCGHPCPSKCSEPCGICTRKVKKTVPGCNHTVQLPCFEEPTKAMCKKKCPRLMDCGHVCGRICRDPCDSSKCKEIVEVRILAKCGHIVKKVPCFVKTSYKRDQSSIKNLESYCSEPCTAILNCSPEDKHHCGGTCGSCYQGRIHQRCTQKCSRILICDHECTGYCRETCKPCVLKCSFKCKHNICKRRCGDQCTICKEPCSRRCKHQRCTKKCGEICNVPPCEEPCEKLLTCGHPCIGFCSEPCPPLCRICDEDEVKEIFFGTEDEEDARFILLNDCGHILENTGMKEWLKHDQLAIKFKLCPKCKTKIFVTERYSDYVKKAVQGISAAKIKGIGTQKMIAEKCSELLIKLQTLLNSIELRRNNIGSLLIQRSTALLERLRKVDKSGRVQLLNLVELNAIEIKYQLTERVSKILGLADFGYLTSNQTAPLEAQVDLILKTLLREIDDITTPEVEDIQREINRLHRMVQMLPLLNKMKYQERSVQLRIMSLDDLINALSKYDVKKDEGVKNEISDLRKKLSLLEITELEKQEVVKAIGMSKGHWFQCPNGHPYVITECGGAMQTSLCPECRAPIGGQNHSLLETNRLATFMDGATHAAWSDYQNMHNYQF